MLSLLETVFWWLTKICQGSRRCHLEDLGDIYFYISVLDKKLYYAVACMKTNQLLGQFFVPSNNILSRSIVVKYYT